MTEVNITSSSFKYGTLSYFRAKAENVEMGSYGEKKTPFGSAAYLSVQNKVKSEYLNGRVRFATRCDRLTRVQRCAPNRRSSSPPRSPV